MNQRFSSAVRAQLSLRNICSALALIAFTVFALGLSESPLHASAALPGVATTPATDAVPASGQKYELKLHHLHTGESLDVVYRIGDTYIPSAMAKLNHFLRDHRTQDETHYDPREFDLLHSIVTTLGKKEIDIVCGYRTPWSNNFLRTRGGTASPASTGVAKNSQHTQSRAIDIRIPGVATRVLQRTALAFKAGGVGYYPVSQFVHVDVGPVRQWTFGGRSE